MLGNALGGVRKSIGGLLEKPREDFGKTSGLFYFRILYENINKWTIFYC